MMGEMDTPYCEIVGCRCVFVKECLAIFQKARSMNLEFRCPVVGAQGE